MIRGERRGLIAGLARAFLAVLGWLYACVMVVRNLLYRWRLLPSHQVSIPVISVGNLTTGGTGKTPLVIHIAKRLVARNEDVAILARGYGAARDGDLNDELQLIAREVPDARLFPGRDRVLHARAAVRAGATVILLDDGFQHRRLRRDLDIVLLDATEPWGYPPGRVLPRGLMREPRGGIRRAQLAVISRIELSDSRSIERIEEQVRAEGFAGPILRQRIEARRVELLAKGRCHEGVDVTELEDLQGKTVLAACGIGNPSAFAATLAGEGARMSRLVPLPDHYNYEEGDVRQLEHLASQRAVRRIVVTGKDAVKLREILDVAQRPVSWLALGVEATPEPGETLDALLAELCGPPKPAKPTTFGSAAWDVSAFKKNRERDNRLDESLSKRAPDSDSDSDSGSDSDLDAGFEVDSELLPPSSAPDLRPPPSASEPTSESPAPRPAPVAQDADD